MSSEGPPTLSTGRLQSNALSDAYIVTSLMKKGARVENRLALPVPIAFATLAKPPPSFVVTRDNFT
jgi:hypothetical protein